jgi:hypothetical protein
MRSFTECRDRFHGLYDAVAAAHRESPRAHRGHGLDHDVTVAMLAVRIATDERTAEKAFCAGLLHSMDRLVEKDNKAEEEGQARSCLARLPAGTFSDEELQEILVAVLRHGELNKPDQSLTQQVLMDADRLANMMPAVVIRAAQFRPGIPPLEFDFLDGTPNPLSSYGDPQSILDDLRISISEYMRQLRVAEAKTLGTFYATQLTSFIASVETSNRELGLAGIQL